MPNIIQENQMQENQMQKSINKIKCKISLVPA